ncbi:alkyl hydroperoxide reductase subunit F [Colwelliaceae bacterium 6471]
MLNEQLKSELNNYLQNLQSDIELAVFLDNSPKSAELKALAEQIASLSPLIHIVDRPNDNERRPSLLVHSPKNNTEIRFAGLPMGHEFTSLVLALLHSGDHPIKLAPEVIEQIHDLEGDFTFESYISLSCQNCPEVVQALNMLSAINPQITHTMIDGALFEQEVTERNIMAVPSVYLNGKPFAQGRITLAAILAKLDKNASVKQKAELNNKDPYDLLVVGGGPAGASAAIYSARKGIRTGIVAERFGGQVQDTMAIENFISVKATEGPKLVASLEEHVKEYNVDVMTELKASKVVPSADKGGLIKVELENGATLLSRAILLATGAKWREMNVPGEQTYRGKGVAYCPHCDGPLFKGKSVAVIGGGNSGIEAAIDLAGIVEHVTVLEFDQSLRADDVLQKKAASLNNITIITSALTTEVLGDGQKVTGLNYTCRLTDKTIQLSVAGIFVQIGLVPNTHFIKDTIALNQRDEVIINSSGETNAPGIYAAGDVTNSPYKQIIIAMGSGATAALGAFDYLIRTPVASTEELVLEENAA